MKNSPMKFPPLIFFLIILLSACSPSSGYLLEEAERTSRISLDSCDYYLMQIEHPERMDASGRARYCYLKAQLNFNTGRPALLDSLIQAGQEACREADNQRLMKSLKMMEIRIALWKNQFDSVLSMSDTFQKEYPALSDTLLVQIYSFRREAYIQKKEDSLALQMADQAIALAFDTISKVRTACYRISLLSKNGYKEQAEEEYRHLFASLPEDEDYSWLRHEVVMFRMSWLENEKRWKEALQASQYLRIPNRDGAAVRLYLRGKSYESVMALDSAYHYFQLASQSLSTDVSRMASQILLDRFQKFQLPENLYWQSERLRHQEEDARRGLNFTKSAEEFRRVRVENELYLVRMKRQQQLIWLMSGLLVASLLAGGLMIGYLREKRRRMLTDERLRNEQIEEETRKLRYENALLQKETELTALREQEAQQQVKVADLRAALFRKLSVYGKLPSLAQKSEKDPSARITLSEEEWGEILQTVNEAFDGFTKRLTEAYPLMTEKDLRFCCLVKLNVNMKDLSDIYCVSKAAISKRKFRIKTEKMNVTDEQLSLDDFLRSF